MACSGGPSKVNSQAAVKRAYWGLPQDGLSADITGGSLPQRLPVRCLRQRRSYGDPRPDMNKRLTVIWTCSRSASCCRRS